MIRASRDEFLERGFVICRGLIPPGDLEALRKSHEVLVDRQREVWAREARPADPSGGTWETSMQPRLMISRMDGLHNKQTADTIEFWLRENVHGLSSYLISEEDCPPTEMMMMCNPVRDRGPAKWHRDFYPPLNAPLMAYVDDILETGPRYVQWNIPLYDDDVLWVIPGSHLRPNTEEENESINRDPCVAVPGGIQTHLKAGDGVAYILPILHWGSNYSNRLRRTIHGGFSRLTHWESTSWIQYLKPSAQETYTRWHKRAIGYVDYAIDAFRAVIAKDVKAYLAALEKLHPGRGDKGVIKSTICLSKTAKHIYNHRCRDPETLTENEKKGVTQVHPMTLQWGMPLSERFTAEEARVVWERFKPVDDVMQQKKMSLLPGFQGQETLYYFEEVPAEMTLEHWFGSWESGRLND